MPLETVCRQCSTRLRVRDEDLGRSIKCPTCSASVPREDLMPSAASSNPFAGAASSESAPPLNPYASPETAADLAASPGLGDDLVATEGIRTAMRQTRPWVIFAAVLGFLAAGLMILGGLGLTLDAALDATQPALIAPIVIGIVYIVIALVYFSGAWYLLKYGRRIGAFLDSNLMGDLHAALVAQKSFWKLAGIVLLLMFLLSLFFIGMAFFSFMLLGG